MKILQYSIIITILYLAFGWYQASNLNSPNPYYYHPYTGISISTGDLYSASQYGTVFYPTFSIDLYTMTYRDNNVPSGTNLYKVNIRISASINNNYYQQFLCSYNSNMALYSFSQSASVSDSAFGSGVSISHIAICYDLTHAIPLLYKSSCTSIPWSVYTSDSSACYQIYTDGVNSFNSPISLSESYKYFIYPSLLKIAYFMNASVYSISNNSNLITFECMGKYCVDNSLTSCATNCQKYSIIDINVCSTCAYGFYLDSNSQCQSCSSNPKCVECSNSSYCTKCDQGYILIGNSCIACDVSCASCSPTNPGVCLTCPAGYILSQSNICLSQVENSYISYLNSIVSDLGQIISILGSFTNRRRILSQNSNLVSVSEDIDTITQLIKRFSLTTLVIVCLSISIQIISLIYLILKRNIFKNNHNLISPPRIDTLQRLVPNDLTRDLKNKPPFSKSHLIDNKNIISVRNTMNILDTSPIDINPRQKDNDIELDRNNDE